MDDLRLGRLDGDGIGPEVTAATVRVVDAALAAAGAAPPIWVPLPVGLAAIDSHGTPLPAETVDGLAEVDGWVMGPHDNVSYPPPFDRQLNPSGFLRRHFDLYANIRPAVGGGLDLVIVRENTQGFYADRSAFAGSGEWAPTADVAIAQALFTRPAVERIARVAAAVARARRGRVAIVHKANVLPLTMGMFRDVCRTVLHEAGGLDVTDLHVDNCAAQLVRAAAIGTPNFDVIVTENLFGDILSDLAAELAGSLGTAGAINHGDHHAMAQAVHGAAPDIAGRGIANPTALIRSAALLLRWLADRRREPVLSAAADRIERSLASVALRTPDLGGDATTASFTDAVVERLTAGG